MKTNLSKKIFSITFTLLLGLMAVMLIFQTFFFESFYEIKKKNKLAKETVKFSTLYGTEGLDKNTMVMALKVFEEDNSAKIGIFSAQTQELLYIPDATGKNSEDVRILSQFCSDLLKNETLRNEILGNKKTQTILFTDAYSQKKKIGVMTPMSMLTDSDTIIVSVASIQPIEEATSVIKEFFVYIFIGFIFVSVMLSIIYTNLISKPLLSINKVAKKMSKMDFSEKCVIDRDDEIGSLASTLNFLSTNLDGALSDLQEKNKRLEEDIEKERKIELMRKDFVDSVSHELKTPIGIIEGYAEGLKDGIVKGENARDYLNTIIDESNKMSILVSNMLELSKLESGAVLLNKEVFNINRLIKHLVSTFQLEAKEHNLKMEFIENTPYSYVLGDKFKIEQILTNLITNAIKYTPSGNVIYLIISQEMDIYSLKVINEGITIDENKIDKLFNKFYRLDKSGDRSKNSTGLGLSIVKNLLELHNFNYKFNNISTGMEFTIEFPIEKSPEE